MTMITTSADRIRRGSDDDDGDDDDDETMVKMMNRTMIMRMETTMTMITTSADRIRRDSQDDDEVSVVRRKRSGSMVWAFHRH